MPNSLGAAHLALLLRAAPDGVSASDDDEANCLCTLARVGLLARHQAGIYALTDAGRRYLDIEQPLRAPPGGG